MAKNLRTEVSRRGLQKPVKAPGRFNREGAFSPTYGQGSDQDDDQDQGQGKEKEDHPAETPRAKGKKCRSNQPGPYNRKKVKNDDPDQADPTCEACGTKWHNWKKCYYVFPMKVPDWFKFNPIIKDGVKLRLASPEWKARLKDYKAGPAKSD